MNTQITPILKVSDINKSIEFYCSILGFVKHWEYASPDQTYHYVSLYLDKAELHLSNFPNDGQFGSVIYINVGEIDLLHASFIKAGLKSIELEPTNQTWQQREMYIRDPDGNSLRFGMPIN